MHEETAHYAQLSRTELSHILISSAVLAFVLSFRDWGDTEFSAVAGITTLFVVFITAIAIIFLRVAVQKLLAVKQGYFLTYQVHKWGTAISFFFSFLFNGTLFYVPVIPAYVTPGEISCQTSKRLKLGSQYYGLNYGDLAKLAIAGMLVSVVIMVLLQPIVMLTKNFYVYKIIQTSAAIAIGSLIPLPGSDGFHIFYFKRWLWLLCFAFILIYFLLILGMQIHSLIIALVLALVVFFLFKRHFD